jgi:hypothetical protein
VHLPSEFLKIGTRPQRNLRGKFNGGVGAPNNAEVILISKLLKSRKQKTSYYSHFFVNGFIDDFFASFQLI